MASKRNRGTFHLSIFHRIRQGRNHTIKTVLLVSVLVLTQMGWLLPFALTAAYAFLSIRLENLTVLDYIRFPYMRDREIRNSVEQKGSISMPALSSTESRL